MTPTNKNGSRAPRASATMAIEIPNRLYFRIGDVAGLLGVKPHVLRYWESEFPVVSPQKSSSGQRVYRRSDVETLVMIKHLLHDERYSIEGARKRIRELRKEGALKSFKKEAVEGKAASEPGDSAVAESVPAQLEKATVPSAQLDLIRDAAGQLADLARRPISELFGY